MHKTLATSTWSQDLLEDHIMELLSSEMQCTLAHVEPGTSFADLGVDSVAAAGVVEALSETLDRELPDTLLWDYPSPAALARYLLSTAP